MEPIVEVFRDIVVPPTMPCTFEAFIMSTPDADVTWLANKLIKIIGIEVEIQCTKILKVCQWRVGKG